MINQDTDPSSKQLGKTVGWREYVSLPDLDIEHLRAKIDSGAKTSAIHAEEQEVFARNGVDWVRFHLPLSGGNQYKILEAPISDQREIKNTGGVPELRIIIRTTLLIGAHRTIIDVSLANRKKMEFDLILGRTALRPLGLMINPSRSFILDKPIQETTKPAVTAQ